jgi:hypothetical protein
VYVGFGAGFWALPADVDPEPLTGEDPAMKANVGFLYEISQCPLSSSERCFRREARDQRFGELYRLKTAFRCFPESFGSQLRTLHPHPDASLQRCESSIGAHMRKSARAQKTHLLARLHASSGPPRVAARGANKVLETQLA